MTATTERPTLPDFNGEPVDHTAIKFTGVGTGFNGLDVRPVVMELDDQAYFVVRVRAAESASHYRDKNDQLVRLQRVRAEDMAPIDEETAQRVLREYAEDVQRRKDQIDSQLSFDEEAAAVEREQLDQDGTPGEIADAAKNRVVEGD